MMIKFSVNTLFYRTSTDIEDILEHITSDMDAHLQTDRLGDGRTVFYIGDFQTLNDESDVYEMLQEIHQDYSDSTQLSKY